MRLGEVGGGRLTGVGVGGGLETFLFNGSFKHSNMPNTQNLKGCCFQPPPSLFLPSTREETAEETRYNRRRYASIYAFGKARKRSSHPRGLSEVFQPPLHRN